MQQVFETFVRIFGLSTLRYFVIAGIPFLLCYKLLSNWLAHNKIQGKVAGRADFVREILHSLQTTAVFAFIGCIVMYTPFINFTLIYTHLSDYPLWWLFASVAISLVIHDTYFYWLHRLMHNPKIFRLAHVLHHKSTNPSPWTSYSFHLIEAFTEGAVLFVIVMVIPIHLIGVLLFLLTSFAINVYGHLGYEIAPLWFRQTWLFNVINTSVHHNIHHSKFKGNYGLYFRFWDRLMGTEHPDYVKDYDRVQQNRLADKGAHNKRQINDNIFLNNP